MAQSVAGARLSARLRRSRRHLFSTLGYTKALRYYLICRRRAVAGKTGAYAHFAAGAGTRLNMDSMPYAALVMNYSKDFAAPDQAAAATAIATGERVNNRAIAINAEGKPIKSIIELAREYGRATGLVTDAKLTDATNAAFYAHMGDPNDSEKIAAEFVDRGNIDIAMGGGASQFIPRIKGGDRQDTRDLLLELRGNGFDIVRTRTDLEAVPAWRRPKLFGIFSNNDLAFANQVEERGQQPSLSDMVRRADPVAAV